MADLGFVRNESARQLRAGSSRIIAYVFLDAGNPFFSDVARGAEDAGRESGLALVMCNSDDDAVREDDYLGLLLEQRVRGVLITAVDYESERLRGLPALGVPLVLVDRPATGGEEWCTVGVDDVYGGDLAVAHLIEQGHQRIAFVGGPLALPPVAGPHRGGARALAPAGRPASHLLALRTGGVTGARRRQAG